MYAKTIHDCNRRSPNWTPLNEGNSQGRHRKAPLLWNGWSSHSACRRLKTLCCCLYQLCSQWCVVLHWGLLPLFCPHWSPPCKTMHRGDGCIRGRLCKAKRLTRMTRKGGPEGGRARVGGEKLCGGRGPSRVAHSTTLPNCRPQTRFEAKESGSPRDPTGAPRQNHPLPSLTQIFGQTARTSQSCSRATTHVTHGTNGHHPCGHAGQVQQQP